MTHYLLSVTKYCRRNQLPVNSKRFTTLRVQIDTMTQDIVTEENTRIQGFRGLKRYFAITESITKSSRLDLGVTVV